MAYTNHKEALENEIDMMFGNLLIEWRPRANVELFEALLEQQYDNWLQELADAVRESCERAVPLAFDGETVMPAQWLDEEDSFNAAKVVCQDDSRMCRAMNRSWYNVLHIVNLYCATIKQEIGVWWDYTRQKAGC